MTIPIHHSFIQFIIDISKASTDTISIDSAAWHINTESDKTSMKIVLFQNSCTERVKLNRSPTCTGHFFVVLNKFTKLYLDR